MDRSDIEDMFAALGPVTVKRMFGGKGVYHRGRILALEVRDEMLLKADAISAPAFAAAGARQWSYEGKTGRPVKMPYWSIPDDAYDDPDIMARWVRLAYEASSRASPPSPRMPVDTIDSEEAGGSERVWSGSRVSSRG